MEVFQTNDHYIIHSGEHSLWCSRKHGKLEARSGNELCSAWNPVCIGLVYGVIGKIKIHPEAEWKLLLIRQRTLVGKIAGKHDVYKVDKVAVLSLSDTEPVEVELDLCGKHHFGIRKTDRITQAADGQGKSLQKTWNTLKSAAENVKPKKKDVKDKERFERRILEELIKMYNESDAFYYSTSYDLTSSIQHQYTKSYDHDQPVWKRTDKRFFWNKHMLKELIEQQTELASVWIQPIIQGSIDIQKCELDFSKSSSGSSPVYPTHRVIKDPLSYNMILLSRRSRYRAGTRSKRRGLDETGACANYVETEQMIEFGHHRVSFVQVRGSIPVYWSQTGVKYRPPPKLDKGRTFPWYQIVFQEIDMYCTYPAIFLALRRKLTPPE